MVKLFLRIKQFVMAAGLPGLCLLFYPVMIILVTRGRSLSTAASVDGSSLVQIFFLGICFLVIVNEFRTRSQRLLKKILINSPFGFFIIYTIIGFFSFLWSSDSFLTIYRSLEALVFLVLVASTIKILLERYSYQSVMKWSILFAFWNLFTGILFRLKVVGIGAISIPFLSSRLFFPLFFFIIVLLEKRLLLKIITIFTIIIGFSNKIFIGIALGFLSFVQGNIRQKFLTVLLIVFICFFVAYIGLDSILLNTLFYGRDSVGLEDSSGRNYVWNYLIAKSAERPLLGYGFVSGELDLLRLKFKGAINAHNSILSALINVGYLGLSFLALFFISVIKQVFTLKVKARKTKVAFVATVILILVVSMSAPGIGGRVYGSWIPSIYLLVLIIGLKKYYPVIP